MKLKWNRSEEGFTDSKCGRFSINPLYFGRVSPQWYELKDRQEDPKIRGGWHNTQKEAKAAAQRVVDKENGDLPEEEEWPEITEDML